MSKVSRDNKKAGKKTTSQIKESADNKKIQGGRCPNEGKCCSCKYYGKPCSKTGNYVARKLDACSQYKCKV